MTTPELHLNNDYRAGIEEGLQHRLLNMNASPMKCPEGKSEAYVEGFQQGIQAAERVIQKNNLEPNRPMKIDELYVGDESESESDNEKLEESEKPNFMEEEDGVPVDCMNPLEANSLESSLLNEGIYKLTKRHYFRNGYAVYLKWLTDKLHRANLHEEWDSFVYFSVARHINSKFPKILPMGLDLEVIYIVNKFRKANSRVGPSDIATEVYNYIQKNCHYANDVSYNDVYNVVDEFPSISKDEFYDRLRGLSENVMEEHSGLVWRGTEGVVNNDAFELSIDKLEAGEPYAPACGFNLGIRMLEKNGFVPKSEVETPRKETRTLIVQ